MDDEQEVTGNYDVSFFDAGKQLGPDRPEALDCLAAAKTGLSLFLDEASQALQTDQLTVDQRIHVATIVSYVEGLAARFDRVRAPGFVQRKARRTRPSRARR